MAIIWHKVQSTQF